MARSSIVIERRIRPIYEFLDIGNYKRAQQEADKLLKKQPDFLCAKALKALSLIRCGRIEEAVESLTDIELVETDDEFALQALTYCYRDLGKPDKIIRLYEKALKKQPQNEEFMSHVIMAYVRTGQYKQQNQMAMQLYKLKPRSHLYYLWSVAGTLLQAQENLSSGPTLLALAEKMIQKYVDDNKLTTGSELKFYCVIMELSGKLDKAVQILTSELAKSCSLDESERKQRLIELYFKLDRFEEVFRLTESILRESPDDWFAWINFIKSGVKCAKLNEAYKDSIVEKMVSAVLAHIASSGQSRAAELARLELIERLLENDLVVKAELGTSKLGEPAQAILRCYRLFGDKPSSFSDLEPFLRLVDQTGANKVIEELRRLNGDLKLITASTEEGVFATAPDISRIRSHVCAIQLSAKLGVLEGLDFDRIIVFVKFLIHNYLEGLKFGAGLLPTDLQYCDDYLLIAVVCALFYCQSTTAEAPLQDCTSFLMEIAALLEYGVSKSPANFKFKLVASKIYAALNAAQCLQTTVDSIKLKYIMYDSLWYLIADYLSPAGFYAELLSWCRSSLNFASQSRREITDNVIQCYKSGTLDRILEFLNFRQRLSHSFHLRACKIWTAYFGLIDESFALDSSVTVDVDPFEEDGVDWSQLTDNRDLQILSSVEFLEREPRSANLNDLESVECELRFYELVARLVAVASRSDAWCLARQQFKVTFSCDSAVCVSSNGLSTSSAGEVEPSAEFNRSTLIRKFEDLSQKLLIWIKKVRQNASGCKNSFAPYVIKSFYDKQRCASLFDSIYATGPYFAYLESTLDYLSSIMSGRWQHGNRASKIRINKEAAEGLIRHPVLSVDSNAIGSQLAHLSYCVQTNGVVVSLLHFLSLHCLGSADLEAQLKKKAKKKKQAAARSSDQPLSTSDDALTSARQEFKEYCSLILDAVLAVLKALSSLQRSVDLEIARLLLAPNRIINEEFVPIKRRTIERLEESYSSSLTIYKRITERQKLEIERMLTRFL